MRVGRRERRRGRRSEEGGRESGGEGGRGGEEERANVGGARFLRSSVTVVGGESGGKWESAFYYSAVFAHLRR